MAVKQYRKLLLMLVISFCIMYGVMFLNVDDSSHIYLSTTRFYMSLLMVAPMAIIMLLMMGKMYPHKKLNAGIILGCIAVFTTALIFLRQQTFIKDKQYLQAMIPHHSSAILTSKHANLSDPEVKSLAKSIIESQEREIRQMKNILQRINDSLPGK